MASCEKGELPVAKADRGGSTVTTLDLGTEYRNQIWYKLHGDRIVSTNIKTDWDLQFEAGDKGNHVVLNSAKLMFALNTHKLNMSDVTDTVGFEMNKACDRITTLDSTVLGIFENNSTVYLIDLGVDEDGKKLGMRKLQFVENTPTQFRFQHSKIDGSDLQSVSFAKSDNYNFLQFSFAKNQLQSNIEPPKNDYDLVFTQYTHVFENPYQHYLVAGVLLNRNKVRAVHVEGKTFDNVSLQDTLKFPLSTLVNAIGYNWKYYNFTTSLYQVRPEYVYLIQDVEGYFYKLHFLDFYSNTGQKGFPKFEFRRL